MSDARKSAAAFWPPPNLADMAEMAERALAAIPSRLARHIAGTGITGPRGFSSAASAK
jgi:hypothetical protein